MMTSAPARAICIAAVRAAVVGVAVYVTVAHALAEPPAPQAHPLLVPPAPPPQSNDWSVETVTVTHRSTGPAVWHVTRGSADVAILGVVFPIPAEFTWNTKPLTAEMEGAREVLLPPRASTNIFAGSWFLLTNRALLRPPDGKTLWDLLDPALASRFAAARDMLHQDKDRYDDDAPTIAALRLEQDYMRVNDMTVEEPLDTIRSLARSRNVRVRRIADYDALPAVRELLKLPAATTDKCLDAAVRDVEIAAAHAEPAAEAWAVGDVAGIKANYSEPRLLACIVEISPRVTQLDTLSIEDTVSEITAALARNGKTVAVVSMGQLLRKNGVIERLGAAGISVSAPEPAP